MMTRKLTFSLVSLAAFATAATAAAPAAAPAAAGKDGSVTALKHHDTNAPVNVAADRIEVQDRADRAVFSGNVVAVQGDMTLKAPRVTLAYTNTSGIEIKRIDASGGVTVTSPSETARGSVAIYDLESRLITMLGAVTLVKGDSHVSGQRLVIDLNSGRAVMDARGTTTSGGRVTGTFTVPKNQQQQQPAAAKPPGH
jgi:lipopolysaccharide export system protein LptA